MMHQRRRFGLIKCIWKGNYDSININFQSCGEIERSYEFEFNEYQENGEGTYEI